MRANPICVVALCLSFASPAVGQSADRRAAFAVSVGLIAPPEYHAPISPFGHTVGPAASIAFGPPVGRAWLVPRLGASVHSARAQVSRINVFRLDAGIAVGPPRPLGSIAPFLTLEGGIYQAEFDRCDVTVLLGSGSQTPEPCSGSRTGLGWQVGAGAVIRTRRGPAPFGQIRYTESHRAVDGLVFLVGAIL